jgi:hypothetical protein
MRTTDRRFTHAVAHLVCAAALTGCVGAIGDDDESGDPNGPPTLLPNGRYDCSEGPFPVASEARRLSVVEYENAIRDVFDGAATPSTRYPSSYGASATGYSTEAALYVVGEQGVQDLMVAAEEVAESLASSLSTVLPCSTDAGAGDACALTFIDERIGRAYRRPLASDEVDNLLATYQGGRDSGASFSEAIAMVTVHALQSPQFLYVTEAAAPDARPLDDYEIASRLSFYLWQTIPDEALLAKAASGELSDPEVRRAEAKRMLADARAEVALRRLFREWSGSVDVSPGNKDPEIVPGFDDAAAQSMAESFDRFTLDTARNGTFQDLLTSGDVWVDASMASFLGVGAPAEEWAAVAAPGRSGGILTQPLFLASTAHRADSSYVFRGRFIEKRVMCRDIGAPPPDAQAAFEALPLPEDPTGKDKSATVNSVAQCTGCHQLLDPVGLSFEGFGALGESRDTYASGKPIDQSGETTVDGESVSFESYADMMPAIAEADATAQCFGRQVVRFAMSRPDSEYDGCAAQSIGDLVAGGMPLADAIVEMAVSDSFAYRLDY